MTDSAGSMTTNHDSPLSGVIAFGAGLGGGTWGLCKERIGRTKKDGGGLSCGGHCKVSRRT